MDLIEAVKRNWPLFLGYIMAIGAVMVALGGMHNRDAQEAIFMFIAASGVCFFVHEVSNNRNIWNMALAATPIIILAFGNLI